MKKFKKISVIAASALLLVSFVGCSSKDTTAKIISDTSKLGSYSGKVDLNADVKINDSEMKYSMLSDISVKTDPFFAEVNITTKSDEPSMGGEYQSKMYLTSVDGVNTAYVGYNGEWNKQVVKADNFKYAVSQYNPVDNAVLIMQSATKLTSVGSEQYNGYTADKYEGTIAKGLIPDLMEATGAVSLIGQNIDASYFANAEDLPVTLWVNSEDGIIIGYKLDLTNLVNKLFDTLSESSSAADSSQKLNAVSYICEAVITDYNNEVNTTLPEEALNAKLVVDNTQASGSTDSNEANKS